MKLNTQSAPVEIQGQLEQGSFGIKQSPKAFQILSSGLYSNKPMAIVRELSANAADAHVLNGNQKKPFEIKLPNRLDNQFYIKDFGPGLSHEQVMKLYTTYFDSTKSESNDFIGGLGLGSKSPFSYTDAFTVEARQNGMTRTYSAFVAENGIPQIVQLGESTPTTDPDGLTIGFPVNPSDYAAFNQEAQRILPWFDPFPTVLGTQLKKLEAPSRVADQLSVYPRIPVWAENNWNGQTFVRMGHIIYPLDWNAAGLSEDKGMMRLLKSSGGSSFVFDVPIGSVEVAASREGLQYDRSSKASLKAFAETLMSKLGSILEKDIEKVVAKHTRFEAQARLAKMQNDWGFTFKEASDIFAKRGLHYPNLKASSEIQLPKKNYKTFDLHYLTAGSRSAQSIDEGRYNKSVSAGNVPVSIIPGTAFMFVESNTKGFVGATKALLATPPKEDYFKDMNYNAAVIIVPKDSKKLQDPAYLAEREELLKSVGQPNLRQTSEYVSPKRAAFGSTTVAKEYVEAYMLEGSLYSRSSIARKSLDIATEISTWVNFNASQTDVHFYDKAGAPQTVDARAFLRAFEELSKVAKELKMPSPGKLMGITTRYEPRMKKAFPNGEKNAFEWMATMLQDPAVQKHLSMANPIEHSVPSGDYYRASSMFQGLRKNKTFFEGLGPNWAILSRVSSIKPSADTIMEPLKTFLSDRGITPDIKVPRVDTVATYQKMFRQMPMIAATIEFMEDNDKTRGLTKDIKTFLAAKGDPDIEIVYTP